MASRSANTKALVIPETTNMLALPIGTDAPPNYADFLNLMGNSYLKTALFKKPIMYIDVLEAFWNTAIIEDMVAEDGTTNQVVSCTIKTVSIRFNAADVNSALDLPNEGLVDPPTDDEIRSFLTFIKYDDKVDLARLNKKHLRKEWGFFFDTIIRVFTCRKTGWDQIPSVAQKIVYSLAYDQKLDVGKLILRELSTRLTEPISRRGNEIFLPRFIQSILNSKNSELINLPGIDKSRVALSKSVSKIIFGTLDKKNKVNVDLKLTPYMEGVFGTQRYVEHT